MSLKSWSDCGCLEHSGVTSGTLVGKRNLRWAVGTSVAGRVDRASELLSHCHFTLDMLGR